MNQSHLELSYFAENFTELFEGIHGVLFFLKDINYTIVSGNELFAQHCGFREMKDLIGKNDFDIFSSTLAQQFRNDDSEIFKTGKTKKNLIELFPNYLGELEWFITKKTPIFNHDKKIIGLCGVCQMYIESANNLRDFKDIYAVTKFIKENLNTKINSQQLANISGLSVRQFERRFKHIFKTTAHQYINKLRILKSCNLLLTDNMSIADVAIDLGFYDQSAFSKQFKKIIGVSPLKYLKKHQ